MVCAWDLRGRCVGSVFVLAGLYVCWRFRDWLVVAGLVDDRFVARLGNLLLPFRRLHLYPSLRDSAGCIGTGARGDAAARNMLIAIVSPTPGRLNQVNARRALESSAPKQRGLNQAGPTWQVAAGQRRTAERNEHSLLL